MATQNMTTDNQTLMLLASGAALLWLNRRQQSAIVAPSGVNTPNATVNSERQRDLQQASNGGYADIPPFVFEQRERSVEALLNPGAWPSILPQPDAQ